MTLQTNGDSAHSAEQRNQQFKKGQAVQIVAPIIKPCEHPNGEECTPSCHEIHFQLDEKALQEIVSREDVKDKKVCVVSIVGAFRKGKSFLLDFFLRYLQRQDENWLTEDNERVGGFKWRGGSEKETEGIWMWNTPFFVKAKPSDLATQLSDCAAQNGLTKLILDESKTTNGVGVASDTEICVLLMDVQGTFDSYSTIRACATIFALTAMLSSVQIYNVSHNIQEDDLQHLQVFTEYGRVALAEDADAKPFQNLVVLVRDWSFPYEAPYGFEGGSAILDRRLAITERQHAELQQLRRYIRDCFASLRCFLMPHPGLQVATSQHFDGAVAQVGDEFRDALSQFVPDLVGPRTVAAHTKRVGHQEILAGDLLTYFRTYISIFQTEELPQPKTMYEATAEANNQAATQQALDAYRKRMDQLCGAGRPFVAADLLDKQHKEARDLAMRTFRERRKMGGPQFAQRYEAVLADDMDLLFTDYEKANEAKSLFGFARTPITLLVAMLFNHLVASVLGFVGLAAVNTLLESLGWLLMCAVAFWIYAKYAGRFAETAVAIDTFASKLFDLAQTAVASNSSLAAVRLLGDQLHNSGRSAPSDSLATNQCSSPSNVARRNVSLLRNITPSAGKKAYYATDSLNLFDSPQPTQSYRTHAKKYQ